MTSTDVQGNPVAPPLPPLGPQCEVALLARVDTLGDVGSVLLANHGVFVVGKDIAQAHHRAVVLDWRCRQAWHVEAMGGGAPVRDEVFRRFAAPFDRVSFPGLFEAMARRELRADPSILG